MIPITNILQKIERICGSHNPNRKIYFKSRGYTLIKKKNIYKKPKLLDKKYSCKIISISV